MDSETEIAWTDLTWNPLAGCTRKSAACRHCYAESLTAQFSEPGQWGHGFAEKGAEGVAWTGKIALLEDRLRFPLGVDTPSRIFVNSLSDLFHESLPNEAIDQIFAIMALAPQHIFQVLTKRPKTAQPYLSDPATPGRIEGRMVEMTGADRGAHAPPAWPLPNVWLGVTAENQKEADRRIPLLLQTPAAIRWVAAEPLLESIDLRIGSWLRAGPGAEGSNAPGSKLDWVVAGGEIGTKANACHPDWARSLRDQCAKGETPFFFARWGEHIPADAVSGTALTDGGDRLLDGVVYKNYPAGPM